LSVSEFETFRPFMIFSNRLSINYNKTAYMILTATRSQNCNFKISMNGVRTQQTDSIKYLGVIIDNKLSWKLQISSLCAKLSQASSMYFPRWVQARNRSAIF